MSTDESRSPCGFSAPTMLCCMCFLNSLHWGAAASTCPSRPPLSPECHYVVRAAGVSCGFWAGGRSLSLDPRAEPDTARPTAPGPGGRQGPVSLCLGGPLGGVRLGRSLFPVRLFLILKDNADNINDMKLLLYIITFATLLCYL